MAYSNLEYLRNITDGDPDSMREIILLFIDQVPEFIEKLRKHLTEKNYAELGKEAHKAKSSVMIFGMNDLGHDLKSLQIATINGTGEENYEKQVLRFEHECQLAVTELREELSRL